MINLANNVTNLYGNKGREWLTKLPELVARMEIAYGLSALKPVKNLSYNYVLSGFQGSQPIVLKLGLDVDGFKREASALKAFAGHGAVKVLAADAGVLLLERAIPGDSLKSYFPRNEDDAIHITCECIKRLNQAPIPSANTFPHIQVWLKTLDKNWPIAANYLHKARQLRDDLLNTSANSILLHGDLHHENILQNSGDWVVIDPKGVLGESAYDVAAFIRNPIPELLTPDNAWRIISHRITSFADILKLSEHRILDWCFVQAVLAWVWTLEDGCDESYFKQLTQLFDRKNNIEY